jgi:flavin reductase (DIM6/NTAB) family NADH-FMN oxidoreductase RutF
VACSRFATGVAIVSVRAADGSPHGLTVNSFTSVSCDPPLVLVCIDARCTVLPHFHLGSHFAVNVLSEHQRDHSVRFSECMDARFDGIQWKSGATGAPLICDCLAWFECKVERLIEAGDHIIVLGAVERAEAFEGRPLIYHNSRYAGLLRG